MRLELHVLDRLEHCSFSTLRLLVLAFFIIDSLAIDHVLDGPGRASNHSGLVLSQQVLLLVEARLGGGSVAGLQAAKARRLGLGVRFQDAGETLPGGHSLLEQALLQVLLQELVFNNLAIFMIMSNHDARGLVASDQYAVKIKEEIEDSDP